MPCPPKGLRPLSPAYPQALATIGDHLRKRRLDLGLLQREIADRFGVTEAIVTSWELNRTSPALRFLPQLIRFIGYVPFPCGTSFGDRLKAARRSVGLSQKGLAGVLGVGEGTVALWERGHRHPSELLMERLEAFLAAGSLLQVDAGAASAQVPPPSSLSSALREGPATGRVGSRRLPDDRLVGR